MLGASGDFRHRLKDLSRLNLNKWNLLGLLGFRGFLLLWSRSLQEVSSNLELRGKSRVAISQAPQRIERQALPQLIW